MAWQDDRSGNSDIYGARVRPTGEVIDDISGFVIAGTSHDEAGV
ncbi:MAG: hypothetical protein WKF43_11230 [Acidimicrobiales bacterium]